MWDFDGTLASRPGRWSGTLLEVLDEHEPGHQISRDDLRRGVRDRLPWHQHHSGHEHLNSPEAWWTHVQGALAHALRVAGVDEARASTLAAAFPGRYLDPSRWVVAAGAADALSLASADGWRNAILSNHTPELPDLVDALGLGTHVASVTTSARHGYEKPHPRAFEIALTQLGDPDVAWMVGDNPVADAAGASWVGLPSVWIQPTPLSTEAMDHLDRQYAHNGWDDWRDHCRLTAAGPRQAVELILGRPNSASGVTVHNVERGSS